MIQNVKYRTVMEGDEGKTYKVWAWRQDDPHASTDSLLGEFLLCVEGEWTWVGVAYLMPHWSRA